MPTTSTSKPFPPARQLWLPSLGIQLTTRCSRAISHYVLRSSGAAGVSDEARETLDGAVKLFLAERRRVSVNVSHIQSLGKHISL